MRCLVRSTWWCRCHALIHLGHCCHLWCHLWYGGHLWCHGLHHRGRCHSSQGRRLRRCHPGHGWRLLIAPVGATAAAATVPGTVQLVHWHVSALCSRLGLCCRGSHLKHLAIHFTQRRLRLAGITHGDKAPQSSSALPIIFQKDIHHLADLAELISQHVLRGTLWNATHPQLARIVGTWPHLQRLLLLLGHGHATATGHAGHATCLWARVDGTGLKSRKRFAGTTGIHEGDEAPHSSVHLAIIPDVDILDGAKFGELVP